MQTRILIARHGQTYGNIDSLFCGHSETELTPLGIAQARALGRRLANEEIHAAYASDLSRAHETARYVLEGRGLEPVLEPRLREMHYGEWEARPGKEIYEQHPDLLRDFMACKAFPPGGETVMDVRARTSAAVREAVERHAGQTILFTSHGNAIMAMLAELLDIPLERTWSFWLDNASLTTLRIADSGRVTLLGLNDASHTVGIEEANA